MTILDIQVKNRVARPVGNPFIVCGNKDYVVRFDFDEDWDAYEAKTARFVFNGQYMDVQFSGNECPMPMLYKTSLVKVGVYVDGLSTTSPAVIRCVRSVLCEDAAESGGSFVDVPLTITENGTVETPKNMRYNPIVVDVQPTDVPLTITESGVTETPDGVRYTPITVDIPQPTLNAPEIEFNAKGGYMYILDGKNGNFSKEYELYLNGEKSKTLTGASHLMQEIGATETDEIGIVAVGDLFNNSPMATAIWDISLRGTYGLLYAGNRCIGIDANAVIGDEIHIAGIANHTVITVVGNGVGNMGSASFGSLSNKTVYFPNSITTIWAYGNAPTFSNCENCNFIFGTSVIEILSASFRDMKNCVLDFSKADDIPVLGSVNGVMGTYKIFIKDSLFDKMIGDTNWSTKKSNIYKASMMNQQGDTQ